MLPQLLRPFIAIILLSLMISVRNVTGDASPNRLPLYQCQRNIGPPQTNVGRKPHVFVYVEDRAFKNIAQQVRNQPNKFSNYMITKSEIPCPIGCRRNLQQVLHVTNRGAFNHNGVISQSMPGSNPAFNGIGGCAAPNLNQPITYPTGGSDSLQRMMQNSNRGIIGRDAPILNQPASYPMGGSGSLQQMMQSLNRGITGSNAPILNQPASYPAGASESLQQMLQGSITGSTAPILNQPISYPIGGSGSLQQMLQGSNLGITASNAPILNQPTSYPILGSGSLQQIMQDTNLGQLNSDGIVPAPILMPRPNDNRQLLYTSESDSSLPQLVHISNRDSFTNDGFNPQPMSIPTQIPSPLASVECAEPDVRQDHTSKVKSSNKDSIVVQIPINKYFDCKNTEILIKIAKKGDGTESAKSETDVANRKEPSLANYRSICANRAKSGNNCSQPLYLTPEAIRPASRLNTEIGSQEPRIVDLPINLDDLKEGQIPNTDQCQPQYMVLPPDVLDAAYTNHPSVPTPEDQIKNIVFSDGERQQNTPQDNAPLGYNLDQSAMLNLNKEEQSQFDCRHDNNNVPIKDIDVAEFESFAQQEEPVEDENHDKCENSEKYTAAKLERSVEVKNENASVESKKKSSNRSKSKGSPKDGKQYGLILGPVESNEKNVK